MHPSLMTHVPRGTDVTRKCLPSSVSSTANVVPSTPQLLPAKGTSCQHKEDTQTRRSVVPKQPARFPPTHLRGALAFQPMTARCQDLLSFKSSGRYLRSGACFCRMGLTKCQTDSTITADSQQKLRWTCPSLRSGTHSGTQREQLCGTERSLGSNSHRRGAMQVLPSSKPIAQSRRLRSLSPLVLWRRDGHPRSCSSARCPSALSRVDCLDASCSCCWVSVPLFFWWPSATEAGDFFLTPRGRSASTAWAWAAGRAPALKAL